MRAAFLPASAVPRVPHTPARVVAANGSSPGINSVVSGLSDRLNIDNSSMDAAQLQSLNSITRSSGNQHLSYEPFVEPISNVRTTVPIHTDPVTGLRNALVPIPAGFVHETVLWTRNHSQVAEWPISSFFRRIFCIHDSTRLHVSVPVAA